MRVKDAMLTFVAMGGFAVPVAFQTPASANAAPCVADEQSVTTIPVKDKPDTPPKA